MVLCTAYVRDNIARIKTNYVEASKYCMQHIRSFGTNSCLFRTVNIGLHAVRLGLEMSISLHNHVGCCDVHIGLHIHCTRRQLREYRSISIGASPAQQNLSDSCQLLSVTKRKWRGGRGQMWYRGGVRWLSVNFSWTSRLTIDCLNKNAQLYALLFIASTDTRSGWLNDS
jgi:hypothetical protein